MGGANTDFLWFKLATSLVKFWPNENYLATGLYFETYGY